METTTAIIVAWGATNAAAILIGMRRATVLARRRARARQAEAAGDYQRLVAATSGPNRFRIAARTGLPFPLDQLERDWRYDDERSAAHRRRELHAIVDRLIAADRATA